VRGTKQIQQQAQK